MPFTLSNVPIGSLANLNDDQRLPYIHLALSTPKNLQGMLFSANTGVFINALGKQFGVLPDKVDQIAFAVLRSAIGEIELAKLGVLFSAELKLPNDKAQAIAKEIEKELFAPVMLELNQYLENQKKQSTQQPSGINNVVDLKQTTKGQKGSSVLPKPGQFNK